MDTSTNYEAAKLITSLDKSKYTFLDSNNILHKWVNDEFIGKPAVQTKDLTIKWFDEVNPEDIDTRYYNLDGSKNGL